MAQLKIQPTQLDIDKSDLGLGDVENLKVKLDATTAPTTGDDSGDGYAVGSRWIDVTHDKEYVCLDATSSAAVWTETTGAGGGGDLALGDLTDVTLDDPMPEGLSYLRYTTEGDGYWLNSLFPTLAEQGASYYQNIKNKFDSETDPPTSQGDMDADDNANFSVGSRWLNVLTEEEWVCTYAQVGDPGNYTWVLVTNEESGGGVSDWGDIGGTLSDQIDLQAALDAKGDVTASSTTTFTNKTFDANGTGNSLSNVEVADLASGVLDTDLSSVSGSDDTLPSAKATKTALDAKQPLDSDLTTIAGLTATTDNFMQSKSSAWSSRTPTQVTADLIAMVGDSGSGGTKGLVPAPSSGDAAAGDLKADGTWATAGGGGSTPRLQMEAPLQTTNWTLSTAGSIVNSVSGGMRRLGGSSGTVYGYGFTGNSTAVQGAGMKNLTGHILVGLQHGGSNGTNHLKWFSSAAASSLNSNTPHCIGIQSALTTSPGETLSSVTGGGSAGTTTTLTSVQLLSADTLITFQQNVGTNVKFYANGTLKNTHTTNLPTVQNGSGYFGIYYTDSSGDSSSYYIASFGLQGDIF